MWVAGEWCDAEDGATADVINPATGEVMATTPKATIADVNRCVEASRTALNDASWKAMDPAQRGRILNKMAQATYANAKSLAVIESNNNGKTFREALSEIRYGAWTLEYFAGLSDKIEGTTIPVPGNRLNYTLRQPLGVTVHIVPWNFPLQLALRSIAPALASGCTVIAKPASWTPLSLIAWAKAMEEADVGLPSGVLQVITGSGGLIGDALAGHTGVDGVVLTGGVPTGQAVMAKASENLTPVTLELGGKGANIIFPDANLRYAAKAICFGIFMNAGQMCWAGSRLIVHEDVHDELVDAVVTEVSKWKVGPGMEEGVRIGSLVHQSHREEVMEKLAAGLAMGGTVVCGGNAIEGDGAFMEATVVTGVDKTTFCSMMNCLAQCWPSPRSVMMLKLSHWPTTLRLDCSTASGRTTSAVPIRWHGIWKVVWCPSTSTQSPSHKLRSPVGSNPELVLNKAKTPCASTPR